jgi:hypothetical protein
MPQPDWTVANDSRQPVDPVEEALLESFPASDPPARTLGKDEMKMDQRASDHRMFPWGRMLTWTLVLMAVSYLLTQHARHVFQLLPLLFLFACPLMHLFHHRKHGHSAHRRAS